MIGASVPGTVYDVAIIGTGPDPDDPDTTGYAMAYRHANAYETIDDCELVACADLVPANAEAFAAEYDLPAERVYENYRRMLDEAEPDIVSVTVPPAAHAEIVLGCAKSGVVDAIHCEKPMAATWGESRRMAQECDRRDVQLTINHQRRFGGQWTRAAELLDEGEIGDLERIEMAAPNLYDFGSHSVDLCGLFVDESVGDWVLAGLDYREEELWFGEHNENQSAALWAYENGVHCFASNGYGSGVVGCRHRLLGTEGTIEIDVLDGPALRIKRAGDAEWTFPDCPGPELIPRALEEVVTSLREGTESTLSARSALNATEIIFACYESVRRRGRVDLPLEIEDNPLRAMVESGDLRPEAAGE